MDKVLISNIPVIGVVVGLKLCEYLEWDMGKVKLRSCGIELCCMYSTSSEIWAGEVLEMGGVALLAVVTWSWVYRRCVGVFLYLVMKAYIYLLTSPS